MIRLFDADGGEFVYEDDPVRLDALSGAVSFEDEAPRAFLKLTATELRTVSAWVAYLSVELQRQAEAFESSGKAIFAAYPEGTTLGEIVSGSVNRLEGGA